MIRVPAAFEGTSSAASALRLSTLLLVVIAGWAAFAVQHLFLGYYRLTAIDGLVCVLTLLVRLIALRSGKEIWISLGGHLTLAVSSIGLVFVALYSGQEMAMSTWHLTALPLFAGYHMGTRAAVGWSVAGVVMIGFVRFSGSIFRIEPEYVPDADLLLMGKYVLLLVILGLAVATRRAMAFYISALNEREAVIRERAQEVAEARDEALEAVQAKNQFLANMSHEIRTPLNGIIGMTGVMLDSNLPADQREIVKTIHRSSNTLLAVINEILDFSKIEAGARLPEAIPFDLYECVEDVVDMFAADAWKKGLDLAFLPRSSAPHWVEGDITYLRQVLINLVGNALKFTSEGEVVIEVKEGTRADQVHFIVSDTGVGIPPEKREIVFQSFTQADSSTTRKYGGTGLGLAISKRLVELMGGDIWVEAEPDSGAVFHFTIDAPAVESPARARPTHERITLIGKSARIIGGRAASRDALEGMLKSFGINVSPGPDEIADVVFTFGATDAPTDPGAPVLALLAVSDHEQQDAAMRAGAIVTFWPARSRALRRRLEALATGLSLETPASFAVLDETMGQRIPARVLVAEDNPINQKVARTVLERLGYKPDVVETGLEVVEAVKEKDYDILFMDLQMPELDGVSATERIREEVSPERQPWIVALTASVGLMSRESAELVGMNDYLGKPFDIQTLMVAIERYEAERRIGRRAVSGPRGSAQTAWDQLCMMFADKPDTLAELIDEHITNGRALLRELRDAAREGDVEVVRRRAHSLKSSAAQFGSERVADLSAQIEQTAESSAPEQTLERLIAQIFDAWERAEQRLTRSADGFRSASP